MWTLRFWSDALERAIKGTAQSIAAALTVGSVGVLNLDWKQILSMGGVTFLYSILTSIASSQVGQTGSASILPTTPAPAPIDTGNKGAP